MKLCHVVPSLEARHGGPSRSVRALCAALAAGGDDVTLYATDPAAPAGGMESGDGPARTVLFHRDWPARICRSDGLRRALGATEADVIHHHALWLRTLHYAHAVARRRGHPLVVSPRGMLSQWARQHHRWRKEVARCLLHPGALEAVSAWHVTSPEEAQDLADLGFRQPVCIAPNGVALPGESATALARAHWLAVCPEAGRRRVALFHSRFHEKKRLLELIELWRRLAPPDWMLLVVGIPEQYDVPTLARHAERCPGASPVEVFDGRGHPPPYAVSQLFLLPSHSENFGLVVAEALAHGVAVVTTDTTPWRGLGGRQAGWCVSWNDFPAALAAAIAEEPARLATWGASGRTWMAADFSWERSAALLRTCYAGLISGA